MSSDDGKVPTTVIDALNSIFSSATIAAGGQDSADGVAGGKVGSATKVQALSSIFSLSSSIFHWTDP